MKRKLRVNLDLIEDSPCGVFQNGDGCVQLGSLSVSPHGIAHLHTSFSISAKDLVLFPEKGRQLLGKGSGGYVWRALDRRSGKLVALKEVRITSSQREKELAKELEALFGDLSGANESSGEKDGNVNGSPLCFPHIVDFFGAFIHEGAVWIVLECMDGSLSSLPFPAPPSVVSSITRQVVRGLQYLHEHRHCIHRDIKPGNVLFREDGVVKLSDFGISSHLDGEGDKAHTFVGTLVYMSPERLKGEEHSYAADIWSLGLLVAEMALGCSPYASLFSPKPKGNTARPVRRTTEQLFWKLLQHLSDNNANPVVPLPPTVDPRLSAFVHACLQKDPAHRPNCATLLCHPFLALHPPEEDARIVQEWIREHPAQLPSMELPLFSSLRFETCSANAGSNTERTDCSGRPTCAEGRMSSERRRRSGERRGHGWKEDTESPWEGMTEGSTVAANAEGKKNVDSQSEANCKDDSTADPTRPPSSLVLPSTVESRQRRCPFFQTLFPHHTNTDSTRIPTAQEEVSSGRDAREGTSLIHENMVKEGRMNVEHSSFPDGVTSPLRGMHKPYPTNVNNSSKKEEVRRKDTKKSTGGSPPAERVTACCPLSHASSPSTVLPLPLTSERRRTNLDDALEQLVESNRNCVASLGSK